MKYGSKDEEDEEVPFRMDKETQELWKKIRGRQRKWNVLARAGGFIGTAGFEIGAYFAFEPEIDNCSLPVSGAFQTNGNAMMGRFVVL